jgi:hypothetical protein
MNVSERRARWVAALRAPPRWVRGAVLGVVLVFVVLTVAGLCWAGIWPFPRHVVRF